MIGLLFTCAQVTHPRHLTGNFNAHLAQKLFLVMDEHTPDKAEMAVLKNLVTDSTLMVEGKGKDAYPVNSYLRWVSMLGSCKRTMMRRLRLSL